MTDPYQTQPIPQPMPYTGAGYPQPAPVPPAYPQPAPVPVPYPQAGYAPYPPVQTVPAAPPPPYYYPAPPVYTVPPAFVPEDEGKDPIRKQSTRSINRMALLCFAQTALSTVWGFVFVLLLFMGGIDPLSEENMSISFLNMVVIVLSTGLVPLLFFLIGRKPTVDYLKFEKVGFLPGLLCVLAGSGLVLGLSVLPGVLVEALKEIGYEQATVSTSAGTQSWLGFLVDFSTIAILGPILEEILFRGIILTTLRKYGIGFSVVVSGLLFGLFHLEFCTVLFAIGAGLVLGFIYARTNNLWLNIAVHIMNNAFVIIGQYAGLFLQEGSPLLDYVLFVLFGLAFLSLVLLLTWKRKMFITRRSPNYDGPAQPLTVGQSVSAMVHAAMLWVLLALVVVTFVLAFL